MLRVEGIEKSFGSVNVLKKINFQIGRGEIKSLIGANGSGKSTFVKILGGLYFSNSGEIYIRNSCEKIDTPRDSRQLKIAVAYQDLSLIPQLSIFDNIFLDNSLKLTIEEKKNIVKVFFEKLEIKEELNTFVADLSHSTKSLIEVVKALVSDPDVLILDEVTAALDKNEVTNLFKILKEYKNIGKSVIIVTHRFDEIYNICDSCSVLRNGEIVYDGDLNDISEKQLISHMTGKKIEEMDIFNFENIEKLGKIKKLQVENLFYTHKLKNINFEVYKGEIVGISALQGQGQSELISLIYGELRGFSGEILIDGKLHKNREPIKSLKEKIIYISGDRHEKGIFLERNILENMNIGEIVKNKNLFSILKKASLIEKTMEYIKKMDIVCDSYSSKIKLLSGGNQQKVLFARSLLLAPELVLLDDPTKGVDISARRDIHRLLHELTKNGTSILVYSSDNEELFELCDRVLVMYEGEIILDIKNTQSTQKNIISTMLNGKKEMIEND